MKTLLLLGGSAYLIPVIERAHEMGVRVVTCDFLPDNHAHAFADAYENASIIDERAVLAVARRHSIDGILSFATDPGVTVGARVAEALGLGLVFTEHLDLDFPGDVDYTFDFGAYWQAYAPLCGDRLRLGIEVGMTPATASERETLGTDVPFDLVIGSLHVLDGKDLYFAESYAGQTKEEAYHAYFAKLAEMVRTHAYIDVLGHIDYIARYAPFENPEIAIACFIPNGYSGSEASKAPKAFIDWYMNQKTLRSVEDSLPSGNSLAP